MTVDVDQLLGVLAQVVVIGGGLAAIYFGIKRWVGGIAGDSREAAKQLETSNGQTVGQYVEHMNASIDELKGIGRDNRTRIEVLESWRNEHTRGHP